MEDLNTSNENSNEELTYEERLKVTAYLVGWIIVISIPLAFATIFAISVLATITGTPVNTPQAGQLIMVAGALINILIAYPLVLNFLLKKKFNGFRLKVERDKD